MENRQHGYQDPRQQPGPPPAGTTAGVPPWSTSTRPLSDIRELTEPSLIDALSRRPGGEPRHQRNVSKASSLRRGGSLKRAASVKIVEPVSNRVYGVKPGTESSSSPGSPPDQSSCYSIPPSSVPPRASSATHGQTPLRSHTPQASMPPVPPRGVGFTIPNRGQSRSPVKQAGARLDPARSDSARRPPSRTFVRTPQAVDIPEFPTHRHPRLALDLQVAAPLFVGGGSIEGCVRLTVDEAQRVRHRKPLDIGRLSVDLLGVEEVSGNRRSIFLSLGSELFDDDHPPPADMIDSQEPGTAEESFWPLSPCNSVLPFMLSLPLDTGPPPFQSKQAKIRYLLSATVLLKEAGKHYLVRTTQEVSVLSTYDPEKALTSLPSPLNAADEVVSARAGGLESIRVTAGLHRQVWVSGTSIFVDVHIANKSRKAVKKMDLNLERDILCYKHAPAATVEKSASQARIFESNERTILTRASLRHGSNGWNGVEAYTSDTRTCDLDLPRGHATVKCGKYFEVRYFLNITVSTSHSKLVSVQLPIILIHMNSLDVLPNSVAQVAAAIEEKRGTSTHQRSRSQPHVRSHSRQRSRSSPHYDERPSFSQGRAFAAPRQQSLDRMRAEAADLEELGQILDTSPRKYQQQLQGPTIKKMGSTMSFGALSLGGKSTGGVSVFGGMEYHTPPSNRKARHFDAAGGDEVEAIRDRLRRMRSFDSTKSKRSNATVKSRKSHNAFGKPRVEAVRHELGPHSLGLDSGDRRAEFDQLEAQDVPPRPATGMSFREKLDRSRFEFKAVRRKASGGLKERGLSWWEQIRNKDKEKEGWI